MKTRFNRFCTLAIGAAMLAQAPAHRAMGGKVTVTLGLPS
jgi:hypothetical protein